MRVNLKVMLLVFLVFSFSFAQEKSQPEQEISEFSLSGYDQKGKINWQVKGKHAQIIENRVLLNEVLGNYFGEIQNITITAKRGEFNREKGILHLEEDVVIDTSSGTKLFTNSLDWNREEGVILGKEAVKIARPFLVAEAKGIKAEPNLKRISLNQEVKVDIEQVKKEDKDLQSKTKIIITCDGPLEIDYEKNIALFKNNVKVTTQDNVIYSDEMEVYFLSEGSKHKDEVAVLGLGKAQIKKIIARGNVKIVRGENISYSEEAIYDTEERKIILKGSPQLIISPQKDEAVRDQRTTQGL